MTEDRAEDRVVARWRWSLLGGFVSVYLCWLVGGFPTQADYPQCVMPPTAWWEVLGLTL